MPADFAPLPGLVPGTSAAQQKRLSSLLRAFEAVQSAEVLMAGQAPNLAAQVVLKPRSGRTFTAETLTSLAAMIEQATPGLTRSRLTILQSDGTLLYSEGQCRIPEAAPARTLPPVQWLLLALFTVAALVVVLTRRRTPEAPGGEHFAFLSQCDDQTLRAILARERPEVVGVLLQYGDGNTARRLRRLLGQAAVPQPARPVETDTLALLETAVQRAYGGR